MLKPSYILRFPMIDRKKKVNRCVTIVEVIDEVNNKVHFGVTVQHEDEQHQKSTSIKSAISKIATGQIFDTVDFDPANPKAHRDYLFELRDKINQHQNTTRKILYEYKRLASLKKRLGISSTTPRMESEASEEPAPQNKLTGAIKKLFSTED